MAQVAYDDEKTPEGWAWSQIRKGDWADFNQRCNPQDPPLDVRRDNPRWLDDCRKLSASFVQDLLTREPWRTSTPYAGVRIKGARIVRDPANPADPGVDLENAQLIRSLEIIGAEIEAPITLRHAETDFFVSFNDSSIKDVFDAEGFRSTSDLSAENSVFKENVELMGAKISGKLDVVGSRFINSIYAKSIYVGGDFEVQYGRFANNVDISSANMSGIIDMRRAYFDNTLNAYATQVVGYWDMSSSKFNNVTIAFTKISGPLDMSDAYFQGELDAFRLQVGGYVKMKDSPFFGIVNMSFAKIDNNLDLRDAGFQSLDLSGASIAGELQIGAPSEETKWWGENGPSPVLNLRNAHIGNLADTDKAWPKKANIYLNGVTIDHLGGSLGDTEAEMLKRGADWWDSNWANLNIKYSPSPYSQLSAAFLAMGDRDDANEIRYRAREHERKVAWDDGKWGSRLGLTMLNYIAGYGIGYHTFIVVLWVILFALLGTLILWRWVPEAAKEYKNKDELGEKVRGVLWCFGASLNRLLPIIDLK